MARSYRFRKIERFFTRIASLPARPLFLLVMNLPEPVAHGCAEVMGRLFWLFGVPWRRMSMKNLRLVYKDSLPARELRRIAKGSMINVIRMMIEGTVIFRPPYTVVKNTPIEGEEYLREAVASGRGILMLGSHVGNFLLLICALSFKGYPVHYVFKQPESGEFKEFIFELNRDLKLNPIPLKPRSEATKRSLKTLREKEILWIALDQNTREGDVGVEFFGVKAATARGPAILAQRTGAVVVPAYIRRHGWMKHTIVIKEPIEIVQTGDKEQDVYQNLRRFSTAIERAVLENPTEWWWLHDRWKRAHRYAEAPNDHAPDADEP
jgi:KDO2-lipid IV(A) lauroyltransferase